MTNTIVYVDNDNISFSKYETIITPLLEDSTLTCKIFIAAHDLSKVDDDLLLLYDFFLCKSPIKSKNGSDIALVIECMKDLLSNKSIDKYIIVSNDSDFIPLCKQIKEHGKECWLCINNEHNRPNVSMYHKIINLETLLQDKIKKQRIEEAKRQKEKDVQRIEEEKRQKLLEATKRKKLLEATKRNKLLEATKRKKLIAGKLPKIIEDYITDNNKTKMNLGVLEQLLRKNSLDWRIVNTENKKFKKFLEHYLPSSMNVKGNYISYPNSSE